MASREREHAFSIELTSREHFKSIRLGNEGKDQVFVEGFLGELLELKLVEESMLEVTGTNGTFRLDVSWKELSKHMKGLKGGY